MHFGKSDYKRQDKSCVLNLFLPTRIIPCSPPLFSDLDIKLNIHDNEIMGRTIPSYRLASEGEISNWDEILRKWKVKEKKKDFALRKN